MSYILDALKKSDQERQRRTAPDIHAVHATVGLPRRGRALWPYLLTIALLLNAGLLVWWLRPWRSEATGLVARESSRQELTREGPAPGVSNASLVAQEPVKPELLVAMADRPGGEEADAPLHEAARQTVQPDPDAPMPEHIEGKLSPSAETAPPQQTWEVAETGARPQVASEASESEGPKAIQDKPSSGPDVKSTSGSPSGKAKKTTSDELSPPAPPKRDAPKMSEVPTRSVAGPGTTPTNVAEGLPAGPPQSSPATGAAEGAGKVQSKSKTIKRDRLSVKRDPVNPRVQASAGQPSTAGAENGPLVSPNSESEKGVQQPNDLPPPSRQDMPGLTFSMLVYSEKPADRMVGINGRIMREGQEVAPGLKLESITPDGVIFNYRGQRFRKGVFQ